jgi:hypothetical protein
MSHSVLLDFHESAHEVAATKSINESAHVCTLMGEVSTITDGNSRFLVPVQKQRELNTHVLYKAFDSSHSFEVVPSCTSSIQYARRRKSHNFVTRAITPKQVKD